MSRFFTKNLFELLELKKMTLDQYFAELSLRDRNTFWRSHKEIFKTKHFFKTFNGDKFDLIRSYVEKDPCDFETQLMRYDIKLNIATLESNGWSNTVRPRILTPFHYRHPDRVNFRTGADVKAWLSNAPEWLKWADFKHVLEDVVPIHAKNPASAFGTQIRSALRTHILPHLKAKDFDLLYTDGDTLLNDLFTEETFKACVRESCYPQAEFVEILEMNCTLSALEKGRGVRHSNRVAKNLRRAKLLLEIKDV